MLGLPLQPPQSSAGDFDSFWSSETLQLEDLLPVSFTQMMVEQPPVYFERRIETTFQR